MPAFSFRAGKMVSLCMIRVLLMFTHGKTRVHSKFFMSGEIKSLGPYQVLKMFICNSNTRKITCHFFYLIKPEPKCKKDFGFLIL